MAGSTRMFALAAAVAIGSCVGAADAEPIGTDRPDFVESSETVGKGIFQIETSIAGERTRKSDGSMERTFTTPTLLRYGVAEHWELRLESDGFMRVRTSDGEGNNTLRGAADTSIGLKWHVQDGEGAIPSVGWLLHADLPAGSREFRGRGVRPSLRAALEWELPHEVSVGVMPGAVYESTDQGHRYPAGILAVVVGRSWTERARTFVEVAGQRLAAAGNGGSIVTYDVGAAYLVTDNVQIDTAFSWGATRESPDFFWTVGISARF